MGSPWCATANLVLERVFTMLYRFDDDDGFYYHSWRNNVEIAFRTLSSFLA